MSSMKRVILGGLHRFADRASKEVMLKRIGTDDDRRGFFLGEGCLEGSDRQDIDTYLTEFNLSLLTVSAVRNNVLHVRSANHPRRDQQGTRARIRVPVGREE